MPAVLSTVSPHLYPSWACLHLFYSLIRVFNFISFLFSFLLLFIYFFCFPFEIALPALWPGFGSKLSVLPKDVVSSSSRIHASYPCSLKFILYLSAGCAGSSFGLSQLWWAWATLSCGARDSHCSGASCCKAQAPGHGLPGCSSWA